MQDSNPDLGVWGDLVANGDSLQGWRPSNRAVMTKKSGKQLSDTFRRPDGVHSDVVGVGAVGLITKRV